MTDIVSTAKRSELMAGIKSKNTKPELVVRKALHARGYRFRLHGTDISGKPDVIMKKYRTVIFVHGCFWHGHTGCKLFRVPKSRTEFWLNKIKTNIDRDCRQMTELTEEGWKVLVIWECAIRNKKNDAIALVLERVENFLSDQNSQYLEIRQTL